MAFRILHSPCRLYWTIAEPRPLFPAAAPTMWRVNKGPVLENAKRPKKWHSFCCFNEAGRTASAAVSLSCFWLGCYSHCTSWSLHLHLAWQNELGSGWNFLQQRNPAVAGPAVVDCVSASEAGGRCRRNSHGDLKPFISTEPLAAWPLCPSPRSQRSTFQERVRWEGGRGTGLCERHWSPEMKTVETTSWVDDWVVFSKKWPMQETAPKPKSEKVLGENSN